MVWRRIRSDKRDTELCCRRTDVGDTSGCPLPSQVCTQQRSKDLRHRKWGCQVYFELTAILFQRQMKKRTGNCHTGIVDQSGQHGRAKLCARFSCSPLYGLSVRYIHDQRSEGLSEFTVVGRTAPAERTIEQQFHSLFASSCVRIFCEITHEPEEHRRLPDKEPIGLQTR